MCAKFAAFTISGTQSVCVLAFGKVVAIALSPNEKLKVVHHEHRARLEPHLFIMTNGTCVAGFMHIATS